MKATGDTRDSIEGTEESLNTSMVKELRTEDPGPSGLIEDAPRKGGVYGSGASSAILGEIGSCDCAPLKGLKNDPEAEEGPEE